MSDTSDLNIVNNEDLHRFELALGDELAIVQYQRAGNNIVFTHTEVPVGYEGQGIASKMAYVALEFAKNEGLKVQPLCPFVKKYVDEHSEYQSISWGYK